MAKENKDLITKIKEIDNRYFYWLGSIILGFIILLFITGTTTHIFEIPQDAVEQAAKITVWLQTIGILVIFWIIIQAFTFFMNREKWKILRHLKDEHSILQDKVSRIEKKIDKLLK